MSKEVLHKDYLKRPPFSGGRYGLYRFRHKYTNFFLCKWSNLNAYMSMFLAEGAIGRLKWQSFFFKPILKINFFMIRGVAGGMMVYLVFVFKFILRGLRYEK